MFEAKERKNCGYLALSKRLCYKRGNGLQSMTKNKWQTEISNREG